MTYATPHFCCPRRHAARHVPETPSASNVSLHEYRRDFNRKESQSRYHCAPEAEYGHATMKSLIC